MQQQPQIAEYEYSENKQSLQERHEIIETLAAFATAHGGAVFVGISPEGKRVGIKLGAGTIESLVNDIKQNTQPPLFPSLEIEGAEDNAILTISIEESPLKPVWAYGRPFKRVGRTNQRLSPEETQRLTEQTRGRSWDGLPCPSLDINDVDKSIFDSFLNRAGQPSSDNFHDVLQNLGLFPSSSVTTEDLIDGDLAISNAAILLFTKNPQVCFPEAQVKCARFDGFSSTKFLDQQTINGNVISQIEHALAFVARNTRQSIVITGQATREEVPEYPVTAVREAIANAICHRDYTCSGTVQIRIYDDRLEIWNPGELPPGLTIDDLYREHPSRPRNPRLAAALYRARVIEQWGTGTLRIVEACEMQGMPRPEFSSETGTFKVRFQGVAERLFLNLTGLSENQRRAVAHIQEHGHISTQEYAHLVRVGERTARRHLSEMVTQEILLFHEAGPKSHYTLHPSHLVTSLSK